VQCRATIFEASEEAGAFAGVAGRALLVDASKQDIGVAIDAELLDVLDVSAGVALAPELLPRA
jgi:hypothetical protein